MHAYYVKLTDRSDSVEPVLLTDRSDSYNLKFTRPLEFISALHTTLDAKGLYFEGNEEELAGVISSLALQLVERIRNEETG